MKNEPGGVIHWVDNQTLSKREIFSAMAMQGIITSGLNCEMETRFSEESVAEAAVEYADALIIELEKPNE